VITLVDNRALGRLVHALRTRRGLTQAALATAMGVSQNTVNRLEAGDKGGLRQATFTALAQSLVVDEAALAAFAQGQTDWSVDEATIRLAGPTSDGPDADSVVERLLADRSSVAYSVDVATHSVLAADLLWSQFLSGLERIGTLTRSTRERST